LADQTVAQASPFCDAQSEPESYQMIDPTLNERFDDTFAHVAHAKKRAFLAAFSLNGTITGAAKLAKCSRRSPELWLKKDRDFAGDFEIARKMYCDRLEGEVHRRAILGEVRLKFYNGKMITIPDPADPKGEKRIPYLEHVYSDMLLLATLNAEMPEKYKQVTERKHTSTVDVKHEFPDWAVGPRAAPTLKPGENNPG
jgi:hypothetical protein